ncbi:MAG: SH3 domain-containing protein [Pseudomonadota bacterium]
MRNAVATAVFALGTPALLWADADGPDYYRARDVPAGEVLPIRADPDPEAKLLAAIPPDGDGIRNLLCEGRLSFAEWEASSEAERVAAADRVWCRVEHRGITGWAQGRYLAEGSPP